MERWKTALELQVIHSPYPGKTNRNVVEIGVGVEAWRFWMVEKISGIKSNGNSKKTSSGNPAQVQTHDTGNKAIVVISTTMRISHATRKSSRIRRNKKVRGLVGYCIYHRKR